MKPVLAIERATVFFDGLSSEPRLNHPEGIAIDSDGNIWCGGEEGEIFRIERAGASVERVARTGGFALGIALDASGYLYMCDMKLACVYRLHIATGQLIAFARGSGERTMECPNYAVVDEQSGYLYVSDSRMSGPGVWRFRLDTGEGDLWYAGDCVFANGLALHPEGNDLYVVETFASRISRIPILPDGTAGPKEEALLLPDTVPDGLAFDQEGRLYISCYEPSCIYRYDLQGAPELLIHDKMCLTLDRPTNIAFRGTHELFCANIGANHVSLIDLQ